MSAAAAKRFLPLFNRVLIKKAEPIKETKGGILVPENERARAGLGFVVAVGPGSRNSTDGTMTPCSVKVGDKVLLPDYGGTRVEAGDKEELFMYREGDLLAIVSE